MNVYITNPRGKEKLCNAFIQAGATLVDHLDSSVSLVVPTVDEELPFFAKNRDWFLSQGIKVMVSSDYTIDMCRDKAEFYRFCRRHGFSTPNTMQDNLIAKPRFGKASKGIVNIDRSYIVQEKIDMPEYSIDYFADWEGNTLAVTPRERLKVVNGESTDSRLCFDDNLVDKCTQLATELHIVGHAVVQCFYNGNEVIFIEVNPRFGGGSWMTFNYFNSPLWLVRNTSNEKMQNLQSQTKSDN